MVSHVATATAVKFYSNTYLHVKKKLFQSYCELKFLESVSNLKTSSETATASLMDCGDVLAHSDLLSLVLPCFLMLRIRTVNQTDS